MDLLGGSGPQCCEKIKHAEENKHGRLWCSGRVEHDSKLLSIVQ